MKSSFNPTPRLKSSPVPILFIPFDNEKFVCDYCKSEYSWTLTEQRFCKNCLFEYVKKLTDNNIYLDVIYENVDRCIEHKDSDTQNIQEWCNSCSKISHFNQIAVKDRDVRDRAVKDRAVRDRAVRDRAVKDRAVRDKAVRDKAVKAKFGYSYHNTKCKLCKLLCEYKEVYNALCSNCYFISSEWIESTLVKTLIPIVYLPWWDYSSVCIACGVNLEYKTDCQKWCSYCFIIYTGCRYCLTTNIILGITEQSKCRKCKRIIDIDVTGIEYNLEKFTSKIFTNNNIVSRMNNIKQGSNLVDSVYRFMWKQYYHQKPDNGLNPIKESGQIRFIFFRNNMGGCNYCGLRYSSTILFEQIYCKYCLYLYHKDLSDKNVCLDVLINNTSNSHCTEHESKNIESYTQNIQEWCMNCSEILYFKQIVTYYSFDMNYYYKRSNEIIKYEKDCTLCGRQNLLINTEFSLCPDCYLISSEWIESTLSKKSILVLYLSWRYNIEQCIVCSRKLLSKTSDDCQKWCSNCFTIYAGCGYCLTTNIIFGLTNQFKCKKCERISFIIIDTKDIMEIFIVSANHNTDNHNLIEKYVKNNNISNPLKIYSFISNLLFLDAKYIIFKFKK